MMENFALSFDHSAPYIWASFAIALLILTAMVVGCYCYMKSAEGKLRDEA